MGASSGADGLKWADVRSHQQYKVLLLSDWQGPRGSQSSSECLGLVSFVYVDQ